MPVLPRPDRVAIQPAPYRCPRHRFHHALSRWLPGQVRRRPPRLRHPVLLRRLARYRLDLRHHLCWKALRRPARGLSASPALPSCANRFRHLDTTPTCTSSRVAMTVFSSPSAATSAIFARITSACGSV
jgi:hypothetical protein